MKCECCGEVFEEPIRIESGQTLEVWGAKVWKDESYFACPDCESEDIQAWTPCENCEENEPAEGDDYCPGCRAKIDAQEANEEPNWLRRQAW